MWGQGPVEKFPAFWHYFLAQNHLVYRFVVESVRLLEYIYEWLAYVV